ncbi:dehydrogenase/reductase SDR family member 12-like [Acanthaster planci]|uniref:Dehydrogenase/reductase SDR family member 12-like n=1 Tax=Acanthaster planci TaxID=133434 RepID=A0A8B7YIZ4_ACAPL|nr:dehydrogenase/reductase SDR family member 12-like [Acanthaster planci]
MEDFNNPEFGYPGDECFRDGFMEASKEFDPAALDVDLTGKSFMVTGSNTGIGKNVTVELAKRGGRVHMLCLNADQATRTEIIKDSANENVHLHVLDLSQLRRVYKFAKKFAENWKTLDVLVNCAACVLPTRELTEDGFETNFAMNTMGVYILTKTLLPLLGQTPGSRVIMVSTQGVFTEKLSLDRLADLKKEKLDPFDGHKVYAQSKRQQLIMLTTWARTHSAIHFAGMHPGIVDTPLLRCYLPPAVYETAKRNGRFKTPAEGADTVVWLAASEGAVQQTSGQFYFDRKATSSHKWDFTRSTEAEEQQMMEKLEELAMGITSKD